MAVSIAECSPLRFRSAEPIGVEVLKRPEAAPPKVVGFVVRA
jgi:hypothetical protein